MFFVFTGCSGTNKQVSNDTGKKGNSVKSIIAHYRDQYVFNFNNENLKNIQFEGNITAGRTNIKYQRGLEQQARFIAEKFNDVFSHVESETGIDFAVNPQIYLLRVQNYPQNLNMSFSTEDPNMYPIPMFIEIGKEDANLILSNNIYFPYSLIHEMAETSLIYPDKKGVIKYFHQFRFLIFTATFDDYTRWFREGFANYAGYIALDYFRSNPDENLSRIWDISSMNETPFSSLNEVRGNLFKWEQKANQKLKGDYYSAALGLFLLLEDKFGREAVRDIINDFDNYESLDSTEIKKIINKKLNTDIEQLVKEFKFTKIGIHYNPLNPVFALNKGLEQKYGVYVQAVEPNSIAEKAGIDINDVIVSFDNKPIKSRFDFELALFEGIKKSTAQLQVWRHDQGYKEIQLSLDKPYDIPEKKIAKKSGEAQSIRTLSIVTGLVETNKN